MFHKTPRAASSLRSRQHVHKVNTECVGPDDGILSWKYYRYSCAFLSIGWTGEEEPWGFLFG
jgi:hypothetical protein